MVKNTIRVYARLKQENAQKTITKYEISRRNDHEDITLLPSHQTDPPTKINRYRFRKVFDQISNQEEVFDTVAKPIINSVIHGFNGTIFAYGQTGSGKTYAITGSPNEYTKRGILPRSIQTIFEHTKSASEKFSIYISYLEIYNEIGYDLLNQKHQPSNLEELPRVVLLEDGKGEAHLRNLNVLLVSSEQEAMRLLFLGDTNRTIAETPMNEYSSRSHCIFTIYVTARGENSGLIRRSKLHLVDLAGSERIHKSNISGIALSEAKHINLSLHYLEQVILALSQTNRSHIPYRNSMMTCILRDSLSGNSLTAMLATLAVTRKNLEETITTCKFAQRVAYISTEAVINEEIDPQQEILFLRSEVDELRRQLIQLKGLNANEKLSWEQKENCKKLVKNYINGSNESCANLDMKQVQLCFSIFKEHLEKKENMHKQNCNNGDVKIIEKYDEIIKRKDEEISVLTTLLEHTPEKLKKDDIIEDASNSHQDDSFSSLKSGLSQLERDAFDVFMIDENNQRDISNIETEIQKKFELARTVAATIQKCQSNIIDIRKKLETNPKNGEIFDKLKRYLISHQNVYRDAITQLQDLKNETDFLSERLKQARVQLLHKFKEWLNPNRVTREPQTHNTEAELDVFNCLKNCNEFLSDILSDQSSGYSSDCYTHENRDIKLSNNETCDEIRYRHCIANNFDYYRTNENNTHNITKENYYNERYYNTNIFPNNPPTTRPMKNALVASASQYNAMDAGYLNSFNRTTSLETRSPQNHKQETFKNSNKFVTNAQSFLPENFRNSNCVSPEISPRNVHFQENIEVKYEAMDRVKHVSEIKDSSEFLEFMKTIPLTGDAEVDDEIFNFYRTKFKH